jgi:hypothetical protein
MKKYIINYSATGKLKRLLFLMTFSISSSVLISGCEDVIDVKLSNEDLNLFGVEARITTKDGPSVFLYQTLKVNQDIRYPGISGAEITVSDNANPVHKIVLSEDPAKKGFYGVPQNFNYLGVAGREYTLSILSSGITLTAKEKLSKVEPIDSIVVKPSTRGNKIFLAIFTYGREPAGMGNFYKWDVFVNDTLFNKADRIAVASDEFVDGNYISGLEVFTDFHDPQKPKDRKLNLKDTIVVRQNSISEFVYNFYFQMINQSSTGSLFSVPTANIKSNFTSSDGKPVLGLFTAEDVSVSNTIVINQAIEDQLKK